MYAFESVVIFGILGNILLIVSIARRKQLLKKNYYFLVLHLAVCDLGALIIQLLCFVVYHLGVHRYRTFDVRCLFDSFYQPFHISGIAMMLMVSALRYRATLHPLKPAISRAKLIKVCCVLYVIGLILGLGLAIPRCFNVILRAIIYEKFIEGFDFFLLFVPATFMFVCYCKISLALVKQNKQIKSTCSAVVRNRHNSNLRIFLVSLCTVVCFAFGRVVYLVGFIWITADQNVLSKHFFLMIAGNVLLVAGTHSANPLIYGMIDKRMFRFLKLCRNKTQTPVEV